MSERQKAMSVDLRTAMPAVSVRRAWPVLPVQPRAADHVPLAG